MTEDDFRTAEVRDERGSTDVNDDLGMPLDLRIMMTESSGDTSESLWNFFLRLIGVLGFGAEGFAAEGCDMPMYCMLGDRECLRGILDDGGAA
jgi:hypothetical protein